MRPFVKAVLPLILTGLVLTPSLSQAQNKAVTIETAFGRTVITMLAGQAFLVGEDSTRIRPLSRGDYLTQGDRVRTEEKSRIELKLPDESFIRFDELTVFVLKSAGFDQDRKGRDIDVTLIIGKIWAKVARLLNKEDRFAVSTHTAVAGVRGTTYRMNVNPDRSATVKVYVGEVEVRSQKAETAAARPPRLEEPTVVKGPHPVTMEQWTYIVGAMQGINIQPDGTPSAPFGFSPEADVDEWVRWNLNRDL